MAPPPHTRVRSPSVLADAGDTGTQVLDDVEPACATRDHAQGHEPVCYIRRELAEGKHRKSLSHAQPRHSLILVYAEMPVRQPNLQATQASPSPATLRDSGLDDTPTVKHEPYSTAFRRQAPCLPSVQASP
jgi:hypothetical protein